MLPRAGLPLGIEGMGVAGALDLLGAGDLGPVLVEERAPGKVLHRCTLSLRFANLSLFSSMAKISSTHSRSCVKDQYK